MRDLCPAAVSTAQALTGMVLRTMSAATRSLPLSGTSAVRFQASSNPKRSLDPAGTERPLSRVVVKRQSTGSGVAALATTGATRATSTALSNTSREATADWKINPEVLITLMRTEYLFTIAGAGRATK